MPKLASFDEFRAPWETEAGGDTDIDKPKLKRYIFNLLSDKERLQEQVTTVTGERDTLQSEKDAKAREGETEVDRLKRENEELKNRKPEADPVKTLKLEVALEKGLSAVQYKRLLGTTKEELEQDADELLASWGGGGNGPEGEGGEAEEEDDDDAAEAVRRQPRQPRNSGDPAQRGKGTEESTIDIDAAVAAMPRINGGI